MKSKVVKCEGCYYWQGAAQKKSGLKFCHYCYITGEPRGIAPTECYKKSGTAYITIAQYAEKEKEKKKMAFMGSYTQGTKEAAVRAVLVDKEPQSVVMERFCVARSTLAKWVADAKKEQKTYIDYAEKVEAEMAKPEPKEYPKVVELKEYPKVEQNVQSEYKKNNSGNEFDKVATDLCNVVKGLESGLRKLDSLEIISETEKQVMERLFARVNGFILGLDYMRGMTDGE